MAKLKKTKLITELSKLGIEYDDSMTYNDMYKLYNIAKKNNLLNAVYTYLPGDGEELLIDRPSTPVRLI